MPKRLIWEHKTGKVPGCNSDDGELRKTESQAEAMKKLGLSYEQKNEARKLTESDNKQPSDFHYRSIRMKPLLMIHLLDLGEDEERQHNVPAYGISFPPDNFSKSIDVVANRIWGRADPWRNVRRAG